MDYLNIQKHSLTHFFQRLAADKRLLPTHISLFMALFYFCSSEDPSAPFQVSRPKIMGFSRIKSIATYHKNISDLTAYGYIEYNPSWHPQRGTQIRLIINHKNN
jgi:hypothetical protein